MVAASLASAPMPVSAGALVEADLAGPGETVSDEVEALNAEAIAKFQAGEYDEAVALFEQAYALSPEPNYLFNIGRVYEEKGDIENAVEFYERFVKQPKVELQARELAVERLRVLRAVLEETQREERPQPTPTPEPEPEPKPEPIDKPRPPKLRLAGFALLGIGGAVLVTGAAFGGVASSQSSELEGLMPLEERDALIDKGKRNALIADALFISGGAVALTGLVFVLASLGKKNKKKDRKSDVARARLAPWASPRGTGASLRLDF